MIEQPMQGGAQFGFPEDIYPFFMNGNSWSMLFKLENHQIKYLWEKIEIAKEKDLDHRSNLAGNISKSIKMFDTDDIISKEIFGTKLMFENSPIIADVLDMDKALNLKGDRIPVVTSMWVNFQKKYEFNPIHDHGGLFSFVIWMKIPYDWENEKELPFVKGSNAEATVGNFGFVYHNGKKIVNSVITMNPAIEGHMLVFPSHVNHGVYPFYTSDEERVSISGNVCYHNVL